jgi:hypothetical protein
VEPSRTDTERAAVVFAAWNGARRSASFADLGRFRDRLSRRRTGQTTAKGADGTSECPGGSPHERGAGAPAPNPGTSSKSTNPSACGTQAKDCFRGPVQLSRSSLASAEPLPVCRCSFERRAGCPLSQRAAAKAVFRDAFRTLFRRARNGKDGLPCGRTEHGAMTRVCVRRVGLFDN